MFYETCNDWLLVNQFPSYPNVEQKQKNGPCFREVNTGQGLLLKAREQRHQQLLGKDDLSLIKVSDNDVVVIDLS